MSFTFERLEIPDVVLIQPDVHVDGRGFFLESFQASAFAEAGIPPEFVQMNLSRSSSNVLRGIHFQVDPAAQGKLVQVVRGAAYDVAVDIRPSSPSFGRHVSAYLSDERHEMLWVPPGFAHGFLSLEGPTDFLYLVTHEYSPQHERGIHHADPDLAISWPRETEAPEVCQRDAAFPRLCEARVD